MVPLTVCEVVRDLPAQQGKDIAVLGRYSFRETGISINEQACEPAAGLPARLRLIENSQGPKPAGAFQFDGGAVQRKLTDIRKRTSLGKFRFGTTDYDRWAVVYGRVTAPGDSQGNVASADLLFRGDGVVLFLPADQ